MPSWFRSGFLLIAVLWSVLTLAQSEHPFIARFELIELDGLVRVEWTLAGGNTCNGMDLERSIDGSSFEVIHRIPGICGDPSAEVAYQWDDRHPAELGTLYYRIRLGSDGTSSVKQLRFGQLVDTDLLAYPVPCVNELTVLLNVPLNEWVKLWVHDAGGREVMVHQGIGKTHQLVVGHLVAGRYSLRATIDGQVFLGGFVKW
jgi:hypothetical protein